MKHPIEVSYLDVGSVGSLPIRVPITTVGKGHPRLGILCSVHGDETSSLMIARQFKRKLLKANSLSGSVSIVTATNPFAQATRTRVTSLDHVDLNRNGQGKPDGTLTERLAHTLREFLSGCSFIIDLHEFVMATPTLVVYVPSAHYETDQLILRGIAAFSPSSVWAQETKYAGGLLSTLVEDGIPGFGVETSRLVELSQGVIDQVTEGLFEVAKLMGIIEGQYRISSPPAFIRKPMYSDLAGIWIPRAALLNQIKEGKFHQIKEGETIGEITSLDLIEDVPILSHREGTLIQLASNELVNTGTSIFIIGVNDTDLTAKFQLIAQKGKTEGQPPTLR